MRYAAKYYTRIISVFFLLIVITLITDTIKNGYSYETIHKLLHIGIGTYGLIFLWDTKRKNYRKFALYNGILFAIVALTGWIYPDLFSLDAFNKVDTILHSIVAITGLTAYFYS